MNLSQPFNQRPVATSLLNGSGGVHGLAAFPYLPVAPLPQVRLPTVQVTANLAGASAETMASIGRLAARTPVRPDFRRDPK